jgi:hypothetical protein
VGVENPGPAALLRDWVFLFVQGQFGRGCLERVDTAGCCDHAEIDHDIADLFPHVSKGRLVQLKALGRRQPLEDFQQLGTFDTEGHAQVFRGVERFPLPLCGKLGDFLM